MRCCKEYPHRTHEYLMGRPTRDLSSERNAAMWRWLKWSLTIVALGFPFAVIFVVVRSL